MTTLMLPHENGRPDDELLVDATLNDLFILAIALEGSARNFYLRLSSLFPGCPEVADYWQQYAAEEAEHAGWLEKMRQECSKERLAEPADPFYLVVAQELLSQSLDQVIEQVAHLGDAYQMALQIENSETNAIFNFLVENTARDESARDFLHAMVGGHVRRLEQEFPEKFGSHVELSTIETCKGSQTVNLSGP